LLVRNKCRTGRGRKIENPWRIRILWTILASNLTLGQIRINKDSDWTQVSTAYVFMKRKIAGLIGLIDKQFKMKLF
jgi:hypothetical protein